MYSLVGHIPSASNTSDTDEHSHPSSPTRRYNTPAMLRATWWWNPSITFNIASITAQLFLPYSSTFWNTALYIISRARTVAPFFFSTFTTTPHRQCAFLIFPYRAAHLLLMNETVRPKYWKASVDSSGYRLTQIVTLLSLKQFCSVYLLRRRSSPRCHYYVV